MPSPRAAAIIATAGLALLVAACGAASFGGSGGSSNAAASINSQALAFARCIRSDGVSHWPDPGANGQFDKAKLTPTQLGVSSSRVATAERACQHQFPNGPGSHPTAAEMQQILNSMRNFARCMRAHRVSNWPDPTATAHHGEPGFPPLSGIDQNSPQVITTIDACRHRIPGASALPPGGYP
jgi:hypothetical protein